MRKMTRKVVAKPRKTTKSEDDVRVKFSENSTTSDTGAGESGRYVYGIVQSRDRIDFGKVGIGGAGAMVYTVNYLDIAAVSATPRFTSSIQLAKTLLPMNMSSKQ
jgi:hypothetical protein